MILEIPAARLRSGQCLEDEVDDKLSDAGCYEFSKNTRAICNRLINRGVQVYPRSTLYLSGSPDTEHMPLMASPNLLSLLTITLTINRKLFPKPLYSKWSHDIGMMSGTPMKMLPRSICMSKAPCILCMLPEEVKAVVSLSQSIPKISFDNGNIRMAFSWTVQRRRMSQHARA